MPGRTRSKCVAGVVSVAAELARCRSSGRTPAALGHARRASTKRSQLAGDGRVPGLVGAGEVATTRRPPATAPSACGLAARRRPGRASRPCAPLRASPVSTLRCTRAVGPAGARPRRRPRRAPRSALTPRGRCPASTAAPKSLAGHVQPGQDRRRRRPAARSASASLELCDAEPGGAAGERGAGRRAPGRARSRRP